MVLAMLIAAAAAHLVSARRDEVTCIVDVTPPAAAGSLQLRSLTRDVLDKKIHASARIAKGERSWRKTGELSLLADGREAPVVQTSYARTAGADGTDFLQFDLDAGSVRSLGGSDPRIGTDKSDGAAQLDGFGAAMALLDKCRDQQLAALGVEPASVDDGLVPAVGSKDYWIANADMVAMRMKPGAYRGYVIWRVGLDGRVDQCRFARSTGNPLLDGRICALALDRGRYLASARDKAGQPVVTWGGRWMNINF